MVNQAVLIRDKHRKFKKILKLMVLFVVFLILILIFYYAYLGLFAGASGSSNENTVVLENPLKNIILMNSNPASGDENFSETNTTIELTKNQSDKVVEQAISEFNKDYINYILLSLGVNDLHKSPTFENPKILIDVGEIWSSEIVKGVPHTEKKEINDEDIKIVLSKEEAINALMSDNIKEYMKNSVVNGNTDIQMIASKPELFSKGYLTMYNKLTGEEAEDF